MPGQNPKSKTHLQHKLAQLVPMRHATQPHSLFTSAVAAGEGERKTIRPKEDCSHGPAQLTVALQ